MNHKMACRFLLCVQFGFLIPCITGHNILDHLLDNLLPGHSRCRADAREPWTYRERKGPEYWGDSFPMCNGNQQSPININTRNTVPDDSLTKLALSNYETPVSRAFIENNGNTILMEPADSVERTISVNGSIYRLQHLHFHWGSSPDRGAEHTINDIQYSMEMHLVHQNAEGQKAVVGVFFQEVRDNNAEVQNIVRYLQKVMYKGDRSEMTTSLNLNNLLPANPASFYRYDGSLTTPNCAEGVTWSVLTKPLSVGRRQMEEFRKVSTAKRAGATRSCRMSDNFRPVQPLNQRIVNISQ